jgi:hypothetical protein
MGGDEGENDTCGFTNDSISKQIVSQFKMHGYCHAEFISASRIFLRQILKQAQDNNYQIAS